MVCRLRTRAVTNILNLKRQYLKGVRQSQATGEGEEYGSEPPVKRLPRLLVGRVDEPLQKGGGGPGAAYVAYVAAQRDGDLDAQIQYAPAAEAERLANIEDFLRSDHIDWMKGNAHLEVTVTSGALFDGFAILEFKGKETSGYNIEGQVKMIADGNGWRFEEEDSSRSR